MKPALQDHHDLASRRGLMHSDTLLPDIGVAAFCPHCLFLQVSPLKRFPARYSIPFTYSADEWYIMSKLRIGFVLPRSVSFVFQGHTV